MAIGTPTSLGTPSTAGAGTSDAFTTSVTAPSDSLIIVVGTWGHSSDRTGTLSGGGLTWTTDHTNLHSFGYTFRIGIFSAPAPSGLASGSTLTLTASLACDGFTMTACYVEGMDLSGTREDISAGTGAAGTGWNTGSASTSNADDLIIGGSMLDGLQTSTATGSATELFDFQFAGNAWSATTTYKIVSSAGSQSLTGTWTGSATHIEAFAAYKSAAGAAAVPARYARRIMSEVG